MGKPEEAMAKYKALMNGNTKPKEPLADSHIILLGAMGAGKTVMAVSASEQCPDVLPAEKLTRLDDIAYVGVELGGLDALTGLRLEVNPKNIVPFVEILADVKDPAVAICHAVDLAKGLGVNKIVIDSISKFDLLVQGYLNSEEGKKLWGGDRFAMFRLSLASHTVAYNKLSEFPGMRIYTCHPMAEMSDLTQTGQVAVENEKVKRQDKANGAYAQADLTMELTGKSRSIWPKDASLVLGVQLVKADGKYKRVALTTFDEKSGLAVKNRFESLLDPIEPSHLGLIVKKVRAFK